MEESRRGGESKTPPLDTFCCITVNTAVGGLLQPAGQCGRSVSVRAVLGGVGPTPWGQTALRGGSGTGRLCGCGSQHGVHIVHTGQVLKEWHQVQELRVRHVVKPRGHWHLWEEVQHQ